MTALCLLPGLAWAQTVAPDKLDELVRDSPFIPAAGATGARGGPSGQLELRSVVVENGDLYFSIYDQGKKDAEWVKIDEPGHAFRARSFDNEHETLTIERDGQTFTLPLRRAKVQGMAAQQPGPSPQPLPSPGAVPANRSNNGNNQPPANDAAAQSANTGAPASTNPVNPQEAQRLQSIVDELRKRRQMPVAPQKQP